MQIEDWKAKIAEIYRHHPFPGIYLPGKQDWEVIREDLVGIRNYSPQILSQLNGQCFWSSWVNPEDAQWGYVVRGDNVSGGDGAGAVSSGYYARCGSPLTR